MTQTTCYDSGGVRVLALTAQGARLRGGPDAIDCIGQALSLGAGLVIIPAQRLDPDFFRLRTGVAGEFVQKFVTYRLRLAVVGNVSEQAGTGPAGGTLSLNPTAAGRYGFWPISKNWKDA